MGVSGLLNACSLGSAHPRYLYRPGAWGVHAPIPGPPTGLGDSLVCTLPLLSTKLACVALGVAVEA